LAAENLELKNQLAASREENEKLAADRQALRAQRDTLMAIQDHRVEAIPQVTSVIFGRWTGGYNLRGGDARGHDAVKVYLIPRDASGSAIKAAGSVTIRLFDLAAPEGAELLGHCERTPKELESQWFTGLLMPDHYSIVCPLTKHPGHADVTIRAEFVDYVTGKTFTATTTVRVDPPSGE